MIPLWYIKHSTKIVGTKQQLTLFLKVNLKEKKKNKKEAGWKILKKLRNKTKTILKTNFSFLASWSEQKKQKAKESRNTSFGKIRSTKPSTCLFQLLTHVEGSENEILHNK